MSQATNRTTFKRGCYYNEGNPGGSYFTIDIFESSDYFNDGYEEDCNFTDDQGVEAEKVFKV